MLRPGNAGSFTATDHLLVLDAAFGQIPVAHRDDVLVTIDGAGASRAVVEHLTSLNTALGHGRRGRRVEYSIGWPVDTRTTAAIEQARQQDRTAGLPRSVDKPAALGEDPDWEYGAVATNTPTGQVQQLEARHRTQAHVEDRIKQLKACGGRNLPSSS